MWYLRRIKTQDIVLAAIIVVVVLAAIYGCGKTANDCNSKGGVLVRGVYWFVCVADDD